MKKKKETDQCWVRTRMQLITAAGPAPLYRVTATNVSQKTNKLGSRDYISGLHSPYFLYTNKREISKNPLFFSCLQMIKDENHVNILLVNLRHTFVPSNRWEMNRAWLWNPPQKLTILSAGPRVHQQHSNTTALENLMGKTISRAVRFRAAKQRERDAVSFKGIKPNSLSELGT
jgi:hypothetical protein